LMMMLFGNKQMALDLMRYNHKKIIFARYVVYNK